MWCHLTRMVCGDAETAFLERFNISLQDEFVFSRFELRLEPFVHFDEFGRPLPAAHQPPGQCSAVDITRQFFVAKPGHSAMCTIFPLYKAYSLCILPIAFWLLVWYNTLVPEGEQATPKGKKKKKKSA